jgi:hypothetical protein
MDIPSERVPADSDAGLTAHPTFDTDPAVTTDHLRRLWEAGGRSITVTYDEQAVRHRAYLAHPRTDI